MKKAIFYGMMVAIATTSCIDDNLNPDLNDGYLKIECPVKTMSRTLIEGTYLPDASNIGISVFDESNSSYNGVIYNNTKYTASGTESDQIWSTETPLRLFSADGTVYGYFPYSESVTDLTKIPVETTSQTDYMYATPTSVNSTSPTANLVMNHALAAIKINLKKGGFLGEGNITNVYLNYGGWSTDGTLNSMTGEITPNTENIGSQIVLATSGQLSQSGTILYSTLVPTATEEQFLIAVEVDGETFNVYNKQTFEQGKLYTYDIILNKANLTVSRCTVTEWEEIETPAQNISEEYTINDEWYQEYISNDGIQSKQTINSDEILYVYIDGNKTYPINGSITVPAGTRNLKIVNKSCLDSYSYTYCASYDKSIDNFHKRINNSNKIYYLCSEMNNLESINCGNTYVHRASELRFPKLKTIYFTKSSSIYSLIGSDIQFTTNYIDLSSLVSSNVNICSSASQMEITGTLKLPKVFISKLQYLFDRLTGTGTLYLPEGATGYDEKIASLPEGWTVEYYTKTE